MKGIPDFCFVTLSPCALTFVEVHIFSALISSPNRTQLVHHIVHPGVHIFDTSIFLDDYGFDTWGIDSYI